MKVGGQWWFHYGYYSNNMLVEKADSGKHSDRTLARQRVRTQIQFIADENLSALLNLEANSEWGRDGGKIDADVTTFVIKRAHLDWTLPNTQVQTRMGIQGIALPSVALGGHPVLNADVAAISVSSQITPELGLTAFWARPYDTSFDDTDAKGKQIDGKNSMDDMDLFGIMLPIKTDAVRFTPWAMFGMIGKDSGFYTDEKKNVNNFRNKEKLPAGNDVDGSSYAWWVGSTFELPVLDPFFVKVDGMMGGLDTGDSDYDTFGWYVAANVGYKFSWGSLSALGFYSSGDEDKDDRGTMPTVSSDTGGNQMTRYGLGHSPYRNHYAILSADALGMWGVGLQLADVSFVDNLKHTVRAFYMGGTNEGDSISRRSTHSNSGNQFFGDAYLMTSDRAWEVNLLSEYTVNQYLKFNFDLAYVWLDLGDHWTDRNDTEGSFASTISVTYSF